MVLVQKSWLVLIALLLSVPAPANARDLDWTPWLNRDSPGGSGDYETLSDFRKEGKACEAPTEIRCRTRDGQDWQEAGQVYSCNVETGGVCRNADQADNRCLDYEVRFRCPIRRDPGTFQPRPALPRPGGIDVSNGGSSSGKTASFTCLNGHTVTTEAFRYPKSQYPGCSEVELAIESTRTRKEYLDACVNQLGGPRPNRVLDAGIDRCEDSGDPILANAKLCCPDPCADLGQATCNQQAVCKWGGCRWRKGSLTCSDLQGEQACRRYDRWCNWNPQDCKKRTSLTQIVQPFECNDLRAEDCGKHSECSLKTECRHRSGMFECNDLNKAQCSTYGKWCRWGGKNCRKRFSMATVPFECRDLQPADCRQISECSLRQTCRRVRGSLTCNDLDAQECPRYSSWCEWKPDRCIKDPRVLAPFECNDLEEPDCSAQSSCGWEERCFYDP